jgi:hypothetical protein
LGPKYGKQMKSLANVISSWGREDISTFELKKKI